MEIHLTADQQAKLAQLANDKGSIRIRLLKKRLTTIWSRNPVSSKPSTWVKLNLSGVTTSRMRK